MKDKRAELLIAEKMSIKSATRPNASTPSAKQRAVSQFEFRPVEQTSSVNNQHQTSRPISFKRCAYDGKEITRALEAENYYNKQLVPMRDLTIRPKVISRKDYAYLLESGPTKEEKEAALVAAERERERLLRESMARKEAIRQMDMRKNREKQGRRMNEIEEETRQRTMHLLERARDLKLEQEDEIKRCNKLILETKCRAIRDAQIAEKRLLEHEETEEERRLNDLMERERISGLRSEELRERERQERQRQFARQLRDQILNNEEERLIEYERKREESRLANLNTIAQQEAELAKMREREAEQERVRRELLESNEQLRHFKAMEREENRIMDMRIQEFHREKTERAAREAEEQRQALLRKERERERVAEQALQARELQAQIDELNASRIQEEVEREWRRREKEEAVRRAENQRRLRSARDEQINNKIQLQAMEMERQKHDFDKILQMQREALYREEREREIKRARALAHRSDILKQVNEREKQKITSRQKMFEEGLAIRAECEQRNRRLREAMERKCQEMRLNKVPDVYINEVTRMIENIK